MVASSWLITSYLVLCYGVAVDWLILLVMVGCGAFYLQVTIVFCFWFFYGSRFLKDSDDKYQKVTLPIIGTICEEFKYEDSQILLDVYKMNTNPLGYCLIVNCSNNHPGCQKDSEDLQKVFSDLNFKVKEYKNLTKTEISLLAEKIGQVDHSGLCCFVLIILFQISGGHIQHSMDQQPIYIVSLIEAVKQCPGLAGKPKIFFIHGYNNEKKIEDTELERSDVNDTNEIQEEKENEEDVDNFEKIFVGNDEMLITYEAKDVTEDGSLYVQSLVNLLRTSSCDLCTLLRKANKSLLALNDVGDLPTKSDRLPKEVYFKATEHGFINGAKIRKQKVEAVQVVLSVTNLEEVKAVLRDNHVSQAIWRKLFLSLGLYSDTLDNIQASQERDLANCLEEGLKQWLKQNDKVNECGGPTWRSLADALEKNGEKAAAENIRATKIIRSDCLQLL